MIEEIKCYNGDDLQTPKDYKTINYTQTLYTINYIAIYATKKIMPNNTSINCISQKCICNFSNHPLFIPKNLTMAKK